MLPPIPHGHNSGAVTVGLEKHAVWAGDPINRAGDSWSPAPFLPLKSKEGAQGPPPHTCPGGLEDGVEALEPGCGMRGFVVSGCMAPVCLGPAT